ncbi:glycerophosphodiester phosphodiesterase [uncultured Parabacteroides sp.]|uniref:glycerophosphodiester phosphodiesterase n=1 Tax=uncultured Parabacteroides sp. TaxID=512312 RepID=UPI0025DD6322|nr:glycerophosphodiester phosphodiesterase [uncultured Parabacteroides sp.]
MQKKLIPYLASLISILAFLSCTKDEIANYELTLEQKKILNTIPEPAIIAHRGTCYWAPEGTEAAMRWARNAGATYLECDLQRTKDGYLVVFHDVRLTRTTDIMTKYPNQGTSPISDFTLEELFNLDIGSWFNYTYPSKARTSFKNLDILTLEDLIKIAEGYKIQRNASHDRIYQKINGRIITQYELDPADNGNRPGIYVETKEPDLYPGIEIDLKNELDRLGWYSDNVSTLKSIMTKPGHVHIANTQARVIVQTFSQASLKKLRQAFPRLIPMCYLIGISAQKDVSKETYSQWLNFAIREGAVIIGPCIYEEDGLLGDLLKPWMHDLIKEKGLLIHAYTFKSKEQIINYLDMVDGFFTNEADDLLSFLLKSNKINLNNSNNTMTGSYILDVLGY